MRIAIVGAGISGLVAANELHGTNEIVVYEKNAHAGGHSETHQVPRVGRAGEVALDTGFIVFNERTYPLFTALLARLGVRTQPSEMSFGVRCDRCGVEYSSRGLRGLFAKSAQMVSPSFYRMVVDIVRFNSWARRVGASVGEQTLGELHRNHVFGDELFRHYLNPMASAIWSASGEEVQLMPIRFVFEFFRNHGLLQVYGHPPWRTVTGGSQSYVEALIRPFANRIRLGSPVRLIRRCLDRVEIKTDENDWECFERVVIATHSDQALALLEDADHREARALRALPYRHNMAVLHTDRRLLPSAEAAEASWNYHVRDCRDERTPVQVTYALNRLQRLDEDVTYAVTLNPSDDDLLPEPSTVIARMNYRHPVFTQQGLEAQREFGLIGGERTHYCGAYLGNGFHEDGVRAGLAVARQVNESRAKV